jgi:UDP-2,4-diacetamido-2,4,6-trideoxy-beta-L-altropyranose hydrolase
MLMIRPVAPGDSRILWEWANEPGVRAASFRSAPIEWDEHLAWFDRHSNAPDCFMYIVTDAAERNVGQVRFDLRSGGEIEIDVSLDRDCRGKGLAAEVVKLACAEVQQRHRGTIVARIKAGNEASRKAFEKAGFQPSSEGAGVIRMELRLHDNGRGSR